MARVRALLFSPTGRLTVSYLAVIMVMSIGFSIIFYNTSVQSLRRTPPSLTVLKERAMVGYEGDILPKVDALLKERVIEGEQALLGRLMVINLAMLIAGAAGAFFLARITLRPIERNMEAQEQFVSDASHELRTPLAAMQSASEVALRRDRLPESEARRILGQNIKEVEKLKHLTDGLLSLANTSEIRRKPMKVSSLIEDAVTRVSPLLIQKEVVLNTDISDSIIAVDERSFPQVIAIILDNAAKYSRERAAIWIKAYKRGGYCFLSVRDEGKGIPEAAMPYIFDRFYRADQSRDTSGYGIGLALAKKIVLQHGGDIIVKSSQDGAEFIVKVPLGS